MIKSSLQGFKERCPLANPIGYNEKRGRRKGGEEGSLVLLILTGQLPLFYPVLSMFAPGYLLSK
jgi:hypothetical protein